MLSDEQIEEHKKDIENGKKAHDKIVCFHDWLLTTMHPIPPHDSSSKERSKNTFFNQNLNEDICHPSALDVRTLTNVTDESIRKVNYSNQLNAVQRHVHSDYCDRNKGKREKENAKNAAKGLHYTPLELRLKGIEIPVDCRFQCPFKK